MLTVTPYWNKKCLGTDARQFLIFENCCILSYRLKGIFFFEMVCRMNASDIIRRNQAIAQWVNFSTFTLSKQQGCVVGCSNNLSPNCTTNYTTYEQRIVLAEGRLDSSNCANASLCLPRD